MAKRSTEIEFTTPTLCHYGYDLSRKWFVHFNVTNLATQETVRKQFRSDINSFDTKKERLAEGDALVAYWLKELKDGWTPFKDVQPDLANMTFAAAIDFAFNACKLAGKSKACYKTTVTRFKKSLGSSAALPLKLIKRQHVRLAMEKCAIDFKLSNAGFNKYLGYVKAVLGRLVEFEIIENNPAQKIKTRKVVETRKYIPYTAKEKDRIREHLFLNYYRYFVILMITYHTGIRPKEVLALRIKDIDLSRLRISIFPILEAENSKTTPIRIVPVNKHLAPFLRELRLQNYPANYFVFGSPYESGKGNRGSLPGQKSGVHHPDYFKPSLVGIKRDTITKLWKRVVMGELKINKYQYAAKHTGANDKIIAGVDLDALQGLYGHSSKLMTIKYVTEIKEIHAQKIMEKSPDF